MSLRTKVRTVDNIDLLSRYLDRHNGTIEGQLLVLEAEAGKPAYGGSSSRGVFRSQQAVSVDEKPTIHFESFPEEEPSYVGEVNESAFAIDAVYVRSRHRL